MTLARYSNLPPGSIKRYPLSDQVVEYLANQIVSGELQPGEPLREKEIAETLGCSRSPLREAFRILAYEGLVELNPGRKATVAPLDARVAAGFFDTRALLESQATRLATQVMSESEMAELLDLWSKEQAAVASGDLNAYRDLNWDLHFLLYSLCQNDSLIELIGVMWRRTLRFGRLLHYNPIRLASSMQHKEELMRLVAEREADAAAEHMSEIIALRKVEVVRAITEGVNGEHDSRTSPETAASAP